MFGSDEIVIEAIGLFSGQSEHLLCARGKVVHLVTHTSKCSHFSGLSTPPADDGGSLAIGLLTCLSRSRTISARSKSRSSAESFSECCFCRCAGWVKMNNSSTRALSTPGNIPTSTPSLINDNKFIVSLDEILCALAKIP